MNYYALEWTFRFSCWIFLFAKKESLSALSLLKNYEA